MKLVKLIAIATSSQLRSLVVRSDSRGFKIAALCRANGEASELEFAVDGSFMNLFIEIAIAEQSLKSLGWVARTDISANTIVLRRRQAAGRASVEHRFAA